MITDKNVFQTQRDEIGIAFSPSNLEELKTQSLLVMMRLNGMTRFFWNMPNNFNTDVFFNNRDLLGKYDQIIIFLNNTEHYLAVELLEILLEIEDIHKKISSDLIQLKEQGVFFILENGQKIAIAGVIRWHDQMPKRLSYILNKP